MDLENRVLTEARYNNLVSEIEVIINGDIFPCVEDRRECYQKNKTEILRRWLDNPQNYCSRPAAYWQFERLGERRIIGRHKWWDAVNQIGEWEISSIEEKDYQYLYRLGLLTKEEIPKYKELESQFASEYSELKKSGMFIEI